MALIREQAYDNYDIGSYIAIDFNCLLFVNIVHDMSNNYDGD